jgi:plastocyanin
MRRLVMLSMMVLAATSDGADKKLSAREEIARLEKELAAQRALLVRMLELQNECTTQMIRAVNGQEVETPVIAEAPPPVITAPSSVVTPPTGRTAPAPSRPAPPPSTKPAAFSGKVHVTSGGPAWVFVEDVKGPAPSGSVEIKQEDKQFSPRIVALPAGTHVSFPNLDVVYHNVFSLSPGQSFDLGMLRAGDPVKSRVLSKPGVVEIFCNLHARMSATVLVTPGPLLTKVARDGSFTIDNVPAGSHQVSAWAGGQVFTTKTVEVGASGATVDFQVGSTSQGPHLNKNGQPYGSYED